MPYLETVDELVESLADALGIYNQQLKLLPDELGHTDDCGCRQCWGGRMEERIRAAVQHEQDLEALRQARRPAAFPDVPTSDRVQSDV